MEFDPNQYEFKFRNLNEQNIRSFLADVYCDVCYKFHPVHNLTDDKELPKQFFNKKDMGSSFMFCYGCDTAVHHFCYGIKQPSQIDDKFLMFICDRCKISKKDDLKLTQEDQKKKQIFVNKLSFYSLNKGYTFGQIIIILFSPYKSIERFVQVIIRLCQMDRFQIIFHYIEELKKNQYLTNIKHYLTFQLLIQDHIICILCNKQNGALKKILNSNDYVHVTCGILSDSLIIDSFQKLNFDYNKSHIQMREKTNYCQICTKQKNVYQCMGTGCGEYAHLGCILHQRTKDPDGEDDQAWDLKFLIKPHQKYLNFSEFFKDFNFQKQHYFNKVIPRIQDVMQKIGDDQTINLNQEFNQIHDQLKQNLMDQTANGVNYRGSLIQIYCKAHTPAPKYCVCGELGSDALMVCCDYCDLWYHPQCIKLDQSKVDEIGIFYCLQCLKWREIRKNVIQSEFQMLQNGEKFVQKEIIKNVILPTSLTKFHYQNRFRLVDFIALSSGLETRLKAFSLTNSSLQNIIETMSYIPFNFKNLIFTRITSKIIELFLEAYVNKIDFVVKSCVQSDSIRFKDIQILDENLQQNKKLIKIFKDIDQQLNQEDISVQSKNFGKQFLSKITWIETFLKNCDGKSKLKYETASQLLKFADDIQINQDFQEYQILKNNLDKITNECNNFNQYLEKVVNKMDMTKMEIEQEFNLKLISRDIKMSKNEFFEIVKQNQENDIEDTKFTQNLKSIAEKFDSWQKQNQNNIKNASELCQLTEHICDFPFYFDEFDQVIDLNDEVTEFLRQYNQIKNQILVQSIEEYYELDCQQIEIMIQKAKSFKGVNLEKEISELKTFQNELNQMNQEVKQQLNESFDLELSKQIVQKQNYNNIWVLSDQKIFTR